MSGPRGGADSSAGPEARVISSVPVQRTASATAETANALRRNAGVNAQPRSAQMLNMGQVPGFRSITIFVR